MKKIIFTILVIAVLLSACGGYSRDEDRGKTREYRIVLASNETIVVYSPRCDYSKSFADVYITVACYRSSAMSLDDRSLYLAIQVEEVK